MNKNNISQRKLDGYIKLAEIIQWGRKNPVKFVERFFWNGTFGLSEICIHGKLV